MYMHNMIQVYQYSIKLRPRKHKSHEYSKAKRRYALKTLFIHIILKWQQLMLTLKFYNTYSYLFYICRR